MSFENELSPIAIVGLDCRLPGAATPDAYWRLLESGESALGELPPERLDRELYFSPAKGTVGKTYSTVGGIVPDRSIQAADLGLAGTAFDGTDSAFLAICDVAARALRNAGYDPFRLSQRNAGVYLGSTGGTRHSADRIFATMIEESAAFLRELSAFRDGTATLSSNQLSGLIDQLVRDVRGKYGWRADMPVRNLCAHVAAQAISRAFSLTGPSMAMDAACASSLQALALGMQALRLGTIDMAIVGGASCLKQQSLVLFSAAQSLTAGKSRPFDADADGLVAAEGYVAIILKRLDDAVADGDSIWGVVRDAASASDGKGKSLWAPRKEGQVLAIERVYRRGIDIRHLQYVEAHATSTQVGDATEITALAEAIGRRLEPGRRIPLGSSKGNIGHTLETAGIAGLAKVLLAMKHQTVPPVAGVTRPNPKLDWERLPFYLPLRAEPWPEPSDGPRLAAVNSFGIGGLNTHVVIEEHRPVDHRRTFAGARPETLSVETKPTNNFEPIAIIGVGAILPGAFTVAALGDLLESGRDARCPPPEQRWTPAARRALQTLSKNDDQLCLGGFLDGYQYDWRKNKVPPKQVAQGNPLQFLLLDATAEALRSAGYESKPFDRQRTGVVVGAIFRGDFCNQLQMGLRLPEFNAHLVPHLRKLGLGEAQIATIVEQYRDYLLEKMPALLDETGSFSSSTLASRITKAFDLMGGAVAIDSGEASGLAAMAVGIDQLRRGDCELVICAGANQSLDFCSYQSLVSKGLELPVDRATVPFSDRNSTPVPGEGVAVLILKRLADAQRDNDPIHAIVRGLGMATNLADRSQAVAQAMKNALASAQLAPAQIAAVETDGPTAAEERLEVEAIATVFGETPRPQSLALRSLAGQTGQCGAAMGIASTISAALQLSQRRLVPGNPVAKVASHVTQHAKLLHLPNVPEPLEANSSGSSKSHIGVLAGGGTGNCYFAILEAGNTSRPVAASTPVVNAESSITAALQSVREASSLDTTTAATNKIISANGRASRDLPIREQTKRDRPSRIVWLFPGQGSQYPGMLKTLAAECPTVADAIAEADAILRAMGFETFTRIAWEDPQGLGTDVWRTQLAMLVADYAMARALLSLGLRPSQVAGHSFGELPALLAADCWSLEDAIRGAWERADAQRRCVNEPAGLMAIFATREKVESLLQFANQPVFVANHNAPEQVVVGGSRTAIERLATVANEWRISSTILPVPCAFHTPLMAPAAKPFADALARLHLKTGSVPVVSTATNRAMIDPADFRDSMVASLTAPVRYVDLIRQLNAQQPTLFVEVGPQRVLTKLNQKILGTEYAHTLSTDDQQRPGLEQLRYIAATCAGVKTSLSVALPATTTVTLPGRLLHFDATQRRRDAHRQASVPTVAPPASQPSVQAEPTSVAKANADADRTAALREFLLRFVVEQTGYPPEMVELDSNLEADLGIDSIKKAQLFGEIAEQFQVAPPTGAMSLDDFPTLRHVLDYLAGSSTTIAETQIVAPPRSDLKPADENANATSTVTAKQVADVPHSQTTADAYREFLLRFVVEQTGYPEEMVDLDSNLEADLGIDSIKKAQLFGEIAEHFHVPAPSGPVSLDDFPTLRHVVDYLVNASPSSAATTTNSSPAAPPLLNHAATRVATSDDSQRVMGRYVYAMHDAPLDSAPRERITGRILIVGRNEDAAALAAAFSAEGADVATMAELADTDAALLEVNRLSETKPFTHLILATPRDSDRMQFDRLATWEPRFDAALLVPFVICQRWFDQLANLPAGPRPTLTAVTAMGGGFGFESTVDSVESGGIAGLVKAVNAEAAGAVRARVVDFPIRYVAQQLAKDVVAELGSSNNDLEIGFDAHGRRRVVRGTAEPASSLPQRSIPVGSVWLVTGGARGVTALVARELGRHFGLKLHLIGSSSNSPVDPRWRGLPREQWKTLRGEVTKQARERGESPSDAWDNVVRSLELEQSLSEFAAAGVSAEYHACDVTDGDRLASLIDEIRRRDGAITGVIHGAGVEHAASFSKKRLPNVHKTLAVKVGGAAHLMRLLDHEPPRFFVGFSSVSGRFGGVGQTDYSMANDMLCKLMKQFADRHPACRAVCLDWPAWDEIGMAARPESRFALQAMKVRFMPPMEGVQHLIDELQSDSDHSEVAIIDRAGRAAHHAVPRPSASDSSQANQIPAAQKTPEADRAVSSVADELSQQPWKFGRQHQNEIAGFLRLAADSDEAGRARLILPPALSMAFATASDSQLREVAAGADVALPSLLAHRPNGQHKDVTVELDRAARTTVVAPAIVRRTVNHSDLPLIDDVVSVSEDSVTARSVLRPDADRFLVDHRVYGQPFLPAVASAEILAEAANLIAPGLVFAGFRDLEYLEGQAFPNNSAITVEASVHRTERGWECELRGSGIRGGAASSVLVRGVAEFLPALPEPPRVSIENPWFSWSPFSYSERGYAPVLHGPSMRTLKEIVLHRDGGQARLAARDPFELAGDRPGRRWLMPSALIDGCLVACGTYAFVMLDGRYGLPQRTESLRIYGLPAEGESCRLRFVLRDHDANGSRYDFQIVDASGRCLVVAENHAVANLSRKK